MVPISHRLLRNAAGALTVFVLAALILPGSLLAHAQLDTPTPADKSTVTEPVTQVTGTYTQKMKVDGSKLVVKDSSGTVVAEGGRDASNAKLMVATPSTPLGTGTYQVEWTTNSSEDDEIARGKWTFTVAIAATPSPTPVPTAAASAAVTALPSPSPTATPAPTATPVPSPSGDGTSTGSGGDVVLPIIVALIVLGAGAAYLLTRRNRPATPA